MTPTVQAQPHRQHPRPNARPNAQPAADPPLARTHVEKPTRVLLCPLANATRYPSRGEALRGRGGPCG